MVAAAMISLVMFDVIVCVVEIPKMLNGKLYRELVTFSVLLLLGTTVAVLTAFEIKVPNPSDFLEWVYSPVSGLMKKLMQP